MRSSHNPREPLTSESVVKGRREVGRSEGRRKPGEGGTTGYLHSPPHSPPPWSPHPTSSKGRLVVTLVMRCGGDLLMVGEGESEGKGVGGGGEIGRRRGESEKRRG